MLTRRAEARPTGWSRGWIVLAEVLYLVYGVVAGVTTRYRVRHKVARSNSITRGSATRREQKAKHVASTMGFGCGR
jgi:uncharacterized membrane protein